MAKKTRVILIMSLAIIFTVITPLVIGYSLGYRIDLENKKITQTGGFYFKGWPRNAQIFLDGKLVKRTDPFFGAAYIYNLIPKNYDVEIRKDDYHSWKKTLQVVQKQVTDAKNVILLPKNPAFEELAQNAAKMPPSAVTSSENSVKIDYYIDEETQVLYLFDEAAGSFENLFEEAKGAKLSPDAKKLLYFSNSEIWVLFLKEELGQPRRYPGDKVLVARFAQKVSDVFWMDDYYLVFSVGEKIKVAEIDDREGLNIVDLAEFAEPKIFFSHENKRLYVLSEGNLYASSALIP
ncbi:MAG: hypothetical protein G01um101430_345 [Parcubacteria group bacterium Gr01-1014_30]|nr:MAG: hypothetical protein G01um101430_345 [Parcubacteria group bacterium Gr01-1014_30]